MVLLELRVPCSQAEGVIFDLICGKKRNVPASVAMLGYVAKGNESSGGIQFANHRALR